MQRNILNYPDYTFYNGRVMSLDKAGHPANYVPITVRDGLDCVYLKDENKDVCLVAVDHLRIIGEEQRNVF